MKYIVYSADQLKNPNINNVGTLVTVEEVLAGNPLPALCRIEEPERYLNGAEAVEEFVKALIASHNRECEIRIFTADYALKALPFDENGELIEVGSQLLCPMKSGGAGAGARIARGRVVKIAEPSHRGYGYCTRILTIQDAASGKKFNHLFPANCIKILG